MRGLPSPDKRSRGTCTGDRPPHGHVGACQITAFGRSPSKDHIRPPVSTQHSLLAVKVSTGPATHRSKALWPPTGTNSTPLRQPIRTLHRGHNMGLNQLQILQGLQEASIGLGAAEKSISEPIFRVPR